MNRPSRRERSSQITNCYIFTELASLLSCFFLVGDPHGVRRCINYGDSFLQVSRLFNVTFYFNLRRGYVFILRSLTDCKLNRIIKSFLAAIFSPFFQLKKVRLRTTFASMDTSGSGVKLSCCEHYENVMYAYSDPEITAVQEITFITSNS